MAIRIGIPLSEYNDMTPHEFGMYLEAYQQRMQEEQKMRIVQAYFTALWQRAKKMPALTEILRDKEPKKPQTPEQMLAIAKAMTLSMGGEVREIGGS